MGERRKRYDSERDYPDRLWNDVFISRLIPWKYTRKGIRGAKFLTYFNKNMDTYFWIYIKGIITPFNKIVCCDTPVYIETTECDYHLPTGYEVIFRYDDFCINVGKSTIYYRFSASAVWTIKA